MPVGPKGEVQRRAVRRTVRRAVRRAARRIDSARPGSASRLGERKSASHAPWNFTLRGGSGLNVDFFFISFFECSTF